MNDFFLYFTFTNLSEVDFRGRHEGGLLVLSDGLGAEHGAAAEGEDEVNVFVEADVVLGVARNQLTLEGHDLKKNLSRSLKRFNSELRKLLFGQQHSNSNLSQLFNS